MILATIDIGSNAARVLINEVTEDQKGNPKFTKLNLLRIPLRLGIDVFAKGEIGEERKQMMIDTMLVFSQIMRIYKVEHYRACATSAMRDARNGQQIIELVKQTSGIQIEIISGDEEATLIYENHIAETMDNAQSYLYIDVGGGSTELTFYDNGKLKYKRSFNIGTIRLMNNLVQDFHWKEMKEAIKEHIKGKKVIAIGSGGNINKVFSMSKTKDDKPLSVDYLKKFYKEASVLSVAQRMEKYKVREDRADVLVPALTIYNNVLDWVDISEIYVPKISVADGLIHSIYDKVKGNNKS